MSEETVTNMPLTVEVPHLLSVREVADILRCSKSQAYNLIYSGMIPTMQVAGKTICRAIDVLEYIQKCALASGLVESGGASMKPSDTSIQGSEIVSAVLSAQRRNKRLMTSSAA
jgi:excisionase family DNA binding protein